VFSTTHGKKPVNGGGKAKRALDREMGNIPPWVLHDLRRVVRSNLSALGIPEHVAELAVGHARKGIQRVYDRHAYEVEIRDALEAWNARLREIVGPEPAPDKVVKLRA
jgi:hypothetical protein